MSKYIYLDNDWEPEFTATQKDATTGEVEPATGLTSQLAYISATRGGSAIHSTLSVSLTERGTTGIYYAATPVQGENLNTHLNSSTYLNKVVWVRFGDGTNITVWEPYIVKQYRPA